MGLVIPWITAIVMVLAASIEESSALSIHNSLLSMMLQKKSSSQNTFGVDSLGSQMLCAKPTADCGNDMPPLWSGNGASGLVQFANGSAITLNGWYLCTNPEKLPAPENITWDLQYIAIENMEELTYSYPYYAGQLAPIGGTVGLCFGFNIGTCSGVPDPKNATALQYPPEYVHYLKSMRINSQKYCLSKYIP